MAIEAHNLDIAHMQKALVLARQAARVGEVPVGAIIVAPDGTVVARAYNTVQRSANAFGHAEFRALGKASKSQGDWRLDGYTLYVTLEPCSLCMLAIIRSRIDRVVYATASPVYGYSLDKVCTIKLDECSVAICTGVCQTEAQQLLRDFFKSRRVSEHAK